MANTDLETTFTNARLDSETLETFINGNDDEFAEPRLNTPYPTVKALIKALIEQGTLDATLFETKEQLLADITLVDGSYALVAEDGLKENNGFYVKKEGVWVFSGYNPLQQSIEYVDNKTKVIKDFLTTSEYAFSISDSLDNIALAVEGDGSVITDSLKAKNLSLDTTSLNSDSDMAWGITDANDNAAIYVDNQGTTRTSNIVTKELSLLGTSVFEKSHMVWGVTDSLDNTAIYVDNQGTTRTANIVTKELSLAGTSIFEKSPMAWGITDANDKTAIYVDAEGVTRTASLDTKELLVNGKPLDASLLVRKSDGNYPANINHFEIFGQSLSIGAYSLPIQTTSQKYDSLMFTGGIRKQHPAYDVPNFYADFVPLVEAAAFSGYVGYETPCGGATDAVKQLVASENGVTYTQQQYQMLGSASGQGGRSIEQLTTDFIDTNLKPTITAAYNLAQAKGKTYAMPLMGWVQGENNNRPSDGTTIAGYQASLQNIISIVDAHLKTLNADLSLDGVITTQLCSFSSSGRTEPHIELAIYEAITKPDTNVYFACPLYIFDYEDNYHVDGVSSKWMGAYIGLAYKRLVVDGVEWKPLHPISNTRQGKIIEVKFHVPVQPLVFDTTQVALNTNYGFTLVDESGVAITITSVEITQPDTVKIIADADIPAGAELRYAWTPVAQPNRFTGARGNLRDSQGNDIVFDPQGINKPLHNWTPIFKYEVI